MNSDSTVLLSYEGPVLSLRKKYFGALGNVQSHGSGGWLYMALIYLGRVCFVWGLYLVVFGTYPGSVLRFLLAVLEG